MKSTVEWFTDTGIHMTQKGKNHAYDQVHHEGIQFLKIKQERLYKLTIYLQYWFLFIESQVLLMVPVIIFYVSLYPH